MLIIPDLVKLKVICRCSITERWKMKKIWTVSLEVTPAFSPLSCISLPQSGKLCFYSSLFVCLCLSVLHEGCLAFVIAGGNQVVVDARHAPDNTCCHTFLQRAVETKEN